MDMAADAKPGERGAALVECPVGDGERGVDAKSGGEAVGFFLFYAFRKAHVFLDAGTCTRGTVAVGNLVAEAGAQAALFHRLGDDVERAVDRVRAGVMIDEGRG